MLSGCHAASHHSAPSRQAHPTTIPTSASAPTLPVLRESFTVTPCNEGTTIGAEGCAERDTLRADARVNALVRRLWLNDDLAGQRLLADAQRDWTTYRDAACRSDADSFRGGSQSAVEYGQCLARLTAQRASALTTQISLTPN